MCDSDLQDTLPKNVHPQPQLSAINDRTMAQVRLALPANLTVNPDVLRGLVAMIEKLVVAGIDNAPAILAALATAGVAVPSWLSAIIPVVIQIVKGVTT